MQRDWLSILTPYHKGTKISVKIEKILESKFQKLLRFYNKVPLVLPPRLVDVGLVALRRELEKGG